MKNKQYLVVVGVIIILLIFIRNVSIKRQNLLEPDQTQSEVDGIKRGMAAKQLALLNYTEAECKELEYMVEFKDVDVESSYGIYVNALHAWGVIEDGTGEFSPQDFMSYADSKELLTQLIEVLEQKDEDEKQDASEVKNKSGEQESSETKEKSGEQDTTETLEKAEDQKSPEEQNTSEQNSADEGNDKDRNDEVRNDAKSKANELFQTLSFDLDKGGNKGILREEWDELYELVLNTYYGKAKESEEGKLYKNNISIKEVYVLGIKDYINQTNEMVTEVITKPNLNNMLKDKMKDTISNGMVITNYGEYNFENMDLSQYIDQNIKIVLKGNTIINLIGVVDKVSMIRNAWIIENAGKEIKVYTNGLVKTFISENQLSKEIGSVVGDLEITDGLISKVMIKPEVINGKVLVANSDYIELEEYGKLELEDYYKIYKIYDELEMELANGILVGYSNTDFVVSGGKICAALIKEDIKAENIRVLIKTNGFKELFHSSVKVTSKSPFTIYYGDKIKKYEAFEEVTIKKSSKLLKNDRLRIETEDSNGKITLLSVERTSGNPEYRGTIEVEKREDGLTIINELSLEEYLYAVVPSEMPASYGLEALKVQSICARSFAYNQLMDNKYSSYGAHVDDSVSYQVYNNISEEETSTLAVKETYGKVLEYDDEVITAYYFSTSSGSTSSAEAVWMSSTPLEYLSGNIQTVEEDAKKRKKELETDLTDEKTFKEFIKKKTIKTYDSEFAWYRWNVTIDGKDVKRSVDKNLMNRYKANPKLILTLKDGKYISTPIDTVGEIKDIKIGKRETGGIITELIIKGSKNTVKILTEYNIRTLLAPINDDVIRQDKSKVSNQSMLPSAFFYMEKEKDGDKLKSVKILGGGFGHGVGMSQNGVKAMADMGKSFEEILKHYYNGIDIDFIY